LAACREHAIEILTAADPGYPRMLAEIHDPPAVLFVRGRLIADDALSVAIVGSRHATHYGLAQAEQLAGSLARAGLTVVSGLARGIDAAAHRGALAAGGRTVAVLGSGLLNLYPPEHEALAAEVAAHGALMSEAPPHSPPLAGAFP
jgi:DNA processing protein